MCVYTYLYVHILQYDRISTLPLGFVPHKPFQFNMLSHTYDSPRGSVPCLLFYLVRSQGQGTFAVKHTDVFCALCTI